MNISLNLLPPEKRKVLYNVHLLFFLKIMAELILLCSAIVAISLIWAGLILKNNLKDFQTRTSYIETENKTINEQMLKINQTFHQANLVYASYVDWSGKLLQLSKINSAGINLTGLDIDSSGEKITLQGKAANRQNLLDYQKNLESSDLVKNLEIPISVLTAKENIDFEIKGQIDLK